MHLFKRGRNVFASLLAKRARFVLHGAVKHRAFIHRQRFVNLCSLFRNKRGHVVRVKRHRRILCCLGIGYGTNISSLLRRYSGGFCLLHRRSGNRFLLRLRSVGICRGFCICRSFCNLGSRLQRTNLDLRAFLFLFGAKLRSLTVRLPFLLQKSAGGSTKNGCRLRLCPFPGPGPVPAAFRIPALYSTGISCFSIPPARQTASYTVSFSMKTL